MAQSKSKEHSYRNPEFEPLDISFLDAGFYNEKGNMREEILDKEVRRLARRFGPGGLDKVSSSQIRRFFGDVRELETKIKKEVNLQSDEPAKLEKHLAEIKLLKSKLAYSAGRGVIPKTFADTLSKSIDQIRSPKDFRAFVLFFESLVGYYYGTMAREEVG